MFLRVLLYWHLRGQVKGSILAAAVPLLALGGHTFKSPLSLNMLYLLQVAKLSWIILIERWKIRRLAKAIKKVTHSVIDERVKIPDVCPSKYSDEISEGQE